MKGTNSANQLRERERREAIADEERRLAELGEEARRAQARLAALQSDLVSTIGASTIQANVVAHLIGQQPKPMPRSSTEKIAVFRSLFRGRDDIYPVRFVSKRTGQAGYAPACANKFVRGVCDLPRIRCGECPNQAFLPVDDAAVRAHLTGKQVMGVYPLLPGDTCWFLAVDFDGASWLADVRAFSETWAAGGVPAVVERSRSGDGAHAWFFFPSRFPRCWLAKWAALSSPIRCPVVTSSAWRLMTVCFQARTRCREVASETSSPYHCSTDHGAQETLSSWISIKRHPCLTRTTRNGPTSRQCVV